MTTQPLSRSRKDAAEAMMKLPPLAPLIGRVGGGLSACSGPEVMLKLPLATLGVRAGSMAPRVGAAAAVENISL